MEYGMKYNKTAKRTATSMTADVIRDVRNPNITIEITGTSAVGKSLGLAPGQYLKVGQQFRKVR
jgi:hypothetical protein